MGRWWYSQLGQKLREVDGEGIVFSFKLVTCTMFGDIKVMMWVGDRMKPKGEAKVGSQVAIRIRTHAH